MNISKKSLQTIIQEEVQKMLNERYPGGAAGVGYDKGKPDLPQKTDTGSKPVAEVPFALNSKIITQVQKLLIKLGHQKELGAESVDGKFGPYTRRAVKEFQLIAGIKDTGEINPQTIASLKKVVKNSAAAYIRTRAAKVPKYVKKSAAGPARGRKKLRLRKPGGKQGTVSAIAPADPAEVTAEELRQCLTDLNLKHKGEKRSIAMSQGRAAMMAPHVSEALKLAGATTLVRKAMMIAQLAVETGGFKYLIEPSSKAKRYEGWCKKPKYNLGNCKRGDGVRFRGRGFIQLTGRTNYTKAGKDLGIDLVNNPHLAAKPAYAAKIAAWYWKWKNLNSHSDREDVREVTRLIQGGRGLLSWRKSVFYNAVRVFSS